MLSRLSRRLFTCIVALLILYGIEEYCTGFYEVDAPFLAAISFLGIHTHTFAFAIYQLIFWILLYIAFTLIDRNGKERNILPLTIGLLFLATSHLIDAIRFW